MKVKIIDTFKDFEECFKDKLDASVEDKIDLWEKCYISKYPELGWHTMEKLQSLAAHELCHVIHFQLRGEDNLPDGVERNNYNIGIWRIYEEGFAQYFQNKLLLNEIDSRGKEWILKCNENNKELKRLYLKALQDNDIGVRNFFGDWFQVLGISDTGYFLGSGLIKRLDKRYGIELTAKLSFSDIKDEVLAFLQD